MKDHRGWRWGGFLFLTVVAAGCGESPATVSGKVTYLTVPVTGGSIKLVFPGGKEAFGTISPEGAYAVQAYGRGIAKVAIETDSAKGMAGLKEAGDPLEGLPPDVKAKMAEASRGLAAGVPVYMKIPPHYSDPEQSGLSVEVKSRVVSKNFDLSD